MMPTTVVMQTSATPATPATARLLDGCGPAAPSQCLSVS
jgi:hypothetical protein